MNAQHCGASLTEWTCRTRSSCMHMTVIRAWLKNVVTNKSTHMYRTEVWVRPIIRIYIIYKACCTQAGLAHAAGVQVMWKLHGQMMSTSTALEPFCCLTHCSCVEVMHWTLTTVTCQKSSIYRLPCGYLCRSSHWIGKFMSGLRPCGRLQGARLFMVHVFKFF